MRDGSQGKWLQQTCTLFLQNGVQLLMEFARQATAWANTSVIRANFSQPKQSLEQTGNNRGKIRCSLQNQLKSELKLTFQN